MPADKVGRRSVPLPVLAPPIAINDSCNHVNGLVTTVGFEMRCQFEFDDGLVFIVLNEEAGIVGAAQERGWLPRHMAQRMVDFPPTTTLSLHNIEWGGKRRAVKGGVVPNLIIAVRDIVNQNNRSAS